ncbi:MAG: leucyl/phenylalanyl-tRNA--protein transferase [Synechococcales cyanobacterium RM1_1_8]|nr:leucyl/phenylalanyl-tRNA--protein transferase [Synechococcales cyanobacterium RM1_1_8]
MDQLLDPTKSRIADAAQAELILEGYRQGYFLMADEEEGGLGWYTSRQRALIPLDDRFRYPKSLQRCLNQKRFRPAIDQDFAGVVAGCANRSSTWISAELKAVYLLLHRTGWAHSFETWEGDRLAGGILGIVIGGAFMGESMFFNISEGSKVAMVELVNCLRARNFLLFDAQMNNPHLERFGACIVDERSYESLLSRAIEQPCQFRL